MTDHHGSNTVGAYEAKTHLSELLEKVEAGEEITITVAGRPVAQLGPALQRRWVSGPALRAVWRAPAPRTLGADLERFPASIVDPFE